jgi:hypothetical protein
MGDRSLISAANGLDGALDLTEPRTMGDESVDRPDCLRELQRRCADAVCVHASLREVGYGGELDLKRDALDRFASLPRHVRVLWLLAAFEALMFAFRAVG